MAIIGGGGGKIKQAKPVKPPQGQAGRAGKAYNTGATTDKTVVQTKDVHSIQGGGQKIDVIKATAEAAGAKISKATREFAGQTVKPKSGGGGGKTRSSEFGGGGTSFRAPKVASTSTRGQVGGAGGGFTRDQHKLGGGATNGGVVQSRRGGNAINADLFQNNDSGGYSAGGVSSALGGGSGAGTNALAVSRAQALEEDTARTRRLGLKKREAARGLGSRSTSGQL